MKKLTDKEIKEIADHSIEQLKMLPCIICEKGFTGVKDGVRVMSCPLEEVTYCNLCPVFSEIADRLSKLDEEE